MKSLLKITVLLSLTLSGTSAASSSPASSLPTVKQQTVGSSPTSAGVSVLTMTPGGAQGLPVLMLPGLGLSGAVFLGLDGTGWAQQFVAAGHAVHVTDGPGSVRGVAPGSVPGLFTWNADQVWSRWGIGPETSVPYENSRFPTERFSEFLTTLTPVLRGASATEQTAQEGTAARRSRAGNAAGSADRAAPPAASARNAGSTKIAGSAATEATETPSAPASALITLLERTGPTVVMAHSASGETAFELARLRPDLVSALIVVEPVGCPGNADYLNVPLLTLFGDHLESRNMTGRMEACHATSAALQASGIPARDIQVDGFSHLMMLERGSEELAREMLAWIEALPTPPQP